MKSDDWMGKRNSRTAQYPDTGDILSTGLNIAIMGDEGYLHTYSGQVAVITAVNLVARMNVKSMKIHIPDVLCVKPLPWLKKDLRSHLEEVAQGANPHLLISTEPPSENDELLFFGSSGKERVIHGSGWEAYVGNSTSPIIESVDANPMGAAMAAVIAASQLYTKSFGCVPEEVYLDTFMWKECPQDIVRPIIPHNLALGEIWTVGTGSVGTSALYFLTLGSRNFDSKSFDMDTVEIENLDRSAIFTNADVDMNKAEVTAKYLLSVGVENVSHESCALDETNTFCERSPGTPDILISAANERQVRAITETWFPPLQIYGTTGKNWQFTLFRHQPMIDPCSCCAFPPEKEIVPMKCATARVEVSESKPIDAALPFLSFGAGLMTAVEIYKFAATGESPSPNRVIMNTRPSVRPVHVPLRVRSGCQCQDRNREIHKAMLEGNRYYKGPKEALRIKGSGSVVLV